MSAVGVALAVILVVPNRTRRYAVVLGLMAAVLIAVIMALTTSGSLPPPRSLF